MATPAVPAWPSRWQMPEASGWPGTLPCEKDHIQCATHRRNELRINAPLTVDSGRGAHYGRKAYSDVRKGGRRARPTRLSGRGLSMSSKRILVVEDGPLVAFAVATSLADAGCIVIGPAESVAEAKRLIGEAQIDGALLDAKLAGDAVDEVAAILNQRNVPFAFVTGCAREDLPAAFRGAPMLVKPFREKDLIATVSRLFADATVGPRLPEGE
jgi:CheY-like chemotaxis protein